MARRRHDLVEQRSRGGDAALSLPTLEKEATTLATAGLPGMGAAGGAPVTRLSARDAGASSRTWVPRTCFWRRRNDDGAREKWGIERPEIDSVTTEGLGRIGKAD